MVKRAEFDRYVVYYLDDKNKLALQAMIDQKESRVISYRELGNMSKVFNVDLRRHEKHKFLGKYKSKKSM